MVDGGNIDVSVEGGSVHAVPGFFEFAGVSCCCLSQYFCLRPVEGVFAVVCMTCRKGFRIVSFNSRLRCSVRRVSTFFDVSPMYYCGQSRQGNIQIALRRSVLTVLSLCLVKLSASLCCTVLVLQLLFLTRCGCKVGVLFFCLVEFHLGGYLCFPASIFSLM